MNSPWNKYETALLIDAYEKVSKGLIRRKDAIRQLSKRLRDGMEAMGISISDTYRNENGIGMQMTILKNVITEGESSFGTPSNVFIDMCNMYHKDKKSYEKILAVASRMYPVNYMSIIQPEKSQLNDVAEEPINGDYHIDLSKNIIIEVFKKKFRNGMKLGTSINNKKFRRTYQELSGESLDNVSDKDLTVSIEQCSVVYKNTAYLPELMLPINLKNKIISYIQNLFLNGENYIFFNNLYQHFYQELLESQIIDVNMFCAYLQDVNNYGWFFNDDEYISIKKNIHIDIEGSVLNYVKEQNGIVTEEEIVSAFPMFPKDDVLQYFRSNSDTLISCGRGLGKIHIDNFQITENELKKIEQFLDKEINRNGFILWSELVDYLRAVVPDVLDYNEQFNDIGIRKALSVKLQGMYNFYHNVISYPNNDIASKDVLTSFAKNHEKYTIDDLKQIGEDLNVNVNPFIGDLLKYGIRIDSENFVSNEDVNFDIEGIDQVIASYCPGEYIPINSIRNFTLFPACEYQWNPMLLESYVFNHSKAFKLMHNMFGTTQVIGAIVRKKSSLDYNDIMADTLAKSDISLSSSEAISYLRQCGLIGSRRLGTINEIINKAKFLKNNRIKR